MDKINKQINKVELFTLIMGIVFLLLGILLPIWLGIQDGPTDTYTIRVPYRGGPMFVEPWVNWVKTSFFVIGGANLLILLGVFMFDLLNKD